MTTTLLQFRFRLFAFSLISFICTLTFGREYILEVESAPSGFKITTNIPRASEPQKQNQQNTDANSTVTFNASSQNFLLSEANNLVELVLDEKGQVCVKQMNMNDALCIKNTTADGNIIFEGTNGQKTHELKLDGRSFFVKTALSVDAIQGNFSGWFINESSLTITHTPRNFHNTLSCFNADNRSQLIIDGYLELKAIDLCKNQSSFSGSGNLDVIANKFLTESKASIALTGSLKILPSQSLENNARRCSWSCILDNFATPYIKQIRNHGVGCKRGFLGDHEQEICLQLKNQQRSQFDQEHDCNEIVLLGTVNVGTLTIDAQNIALQGAVSVDNDCTIKPRFVFRNSGTLYIKGALELKDGDYFYNDVNSIIGVGKTAHITVNKVAANVSGAISGNDITIKADKLINARGAPMGIKQGEKYQAHFNYNQVETFKLGYIYARKGNITCDVNDFLQEASICIASNNIEMKVNRQFSNAARELKEECNKASPGCVDESAQFHYEPSTIAAGGNVIITINGVKIDFNEQRTNYKIPHFYNTGTIQGLQLVELDSKNDQALLANGFTHKLTLPEFLKAPDVIDLQDDLLCKEYEHKADGVYYYTHPLFNETKAYRNIHEIMLYAGNIQQNSPFFFSPLLEAMNLEFTLHKLAGRVRIAPFQDHYQQYNDLVTQGLIYAIIHGTLKSVGDNTPKPAVNSDEIKPRPDKNKNHLLIKIPTRGRPDKFFTTLDKFYAKLSGEIPCTFLITCDSDDTTMNNPTVIERLKTYKNLYFYFGEGSSKVDAYNRDIEKHLDFDIMLAASDDLEPLRQNFDKTIFKFMKLVYPDFSGVLRFEDSKTPHNINQYPIIGKKYYDRFGYIYYPEYVSLYCDDEFVDVAQAFNNELVIKGLLFKHKHPSLVGGEPDDLYKENETTAIIEHDRNLYNSRRQLGTQNFGAKVDHGPDKMLAWRNQRKIEELERQSIKLTPEEISDYQQLIKKFKGRMSPQEFVRRLNKLSAKTHVIELPEWQLSTAPVSFIYYKVENRDGKQYLHPYFHPDRDSIEKLRHANGTITGGEIKATGGNVQNFGFIKADKALLLKVTSFLNERPAYQRLDDIYSVPAGHTEGASTTINTDKNLENSGTIQSTNGDTILKATGDLLSHPQNQTPSAATAQTIPQNQPQMAAKGGNLKMEAHNINIEATTQSATGNIEKTAKNDLTEKTILKTYGEEIVLPDGTRKKVQKIVAMPTTNVAGGEINRTAEKISDEGVENLSVGDQVNTAKNIVSKPATVQQSETESKSQCSWFGCSGKERETLRTIAQQSKYTSLKGSVINKSDLDTTLEGVIIVAGKKVRLVAGKKLIVKGAQETESTKESGWSFGISFLGSDAIQSTIDGNYKDAAIQLASTHKLAGSLLTLLDNVDKKAPAGELIPNIENAGIEALREFVALSKTPEGAGLKGALLNEGQRYATAAASISFNLGFHDKQTNSFSTKSSSINCARLEIEAQNAELRDGVQAKGDELNVKAETLKTTGAESQTKSANSGINISLSAGASGIGVGVQGTTGKSSDKTYQNTNLDFGKQTYDARNIDLENTNVEAKTVNFNNVDTLHVTSKQNEQQSTQTTLGASASTSGTMSASAAYSDKDKKEINQRSGIHADKVDGNIEHVVLTGSDFTGGKDSTVKIKKMEGHDVEDHDNNVDVQASLSSAPGDVAYATTEQHYKVDKDSATHRGYSNLQAEQKTDVTDDPEKAYEKHEGSHWNIGFVLAALDMKQIKEAEKWWAKQGVKVRYFGPKHPRSDHVKNSAQTPDGTENATTDNESTDDSTDDSNGDSSTTNSDDGQKQEDDDLKVYDDTDETQIKGEQKTEKESSEKSKDSKPQKPKSNKPHKKPLSDEEQKKQQAQKLFQKLSKQKIHELLLSGLLDETKQAQLRQLLETSNAPLTQPSGCEFDTSGINQQNENAFEQFFFDLFKVAGKKVLIYSSDISSQFGLGMAEGSIGIALDDPSLDPYTHPGAFARRLGRWWDGLVKIGAGIATIIEAGGIAGSELGGGIGAGAAISIGTAGTGSAAGIFVVGVGAAAAGATVAEGGAIGTALIIEGLRSLSKASHMDSPQAGNDGPQQPGGGNGGGNGNPGNPKDPKGPNKPSGDGQNNQNNNPKSTHNKPPIRTEPNDLYEQIALENAKHGDGDRIMEGKINDPKYPEHEWAKKQYKLTDPNGKDIVIHYWENIINGVREGFKFKNI